MTPIAPVPAAPPASRSLPYEQRRSWLIAIALALLAMLAYVDALHGDFLYDDFAYIVENPQVQQPTAHGILLEPLSGRPQLGLHRPLPTLSYAVQAGGRGKSAPTWPFHLFNVLVHAGVTLLVWRLGRRLGFDEAVAALAAALFAAHPIHVEAVDWIVGRAELLAALFGIGFLVVALRNDGDDERAPRRPRDTWLAALLLALAGLSKESAFVLPIVLVAIEWTLGRRGTIASWIGRHWPWALVLAVLSALRLAALSDFNDPVKWRFGPSLDLACFASVPWWARPLLSMQLFGEYVRRALLPAPPRIFFHECDFQEFAPWAVAGFVAFVVALVLLRRKRPVLAALVAFPIALATVLNLRPIQETFAERFLYLPSAFVLMPVAAWLVAIVRRERAAAGRVGLSLLAPSAAVVALLACTWYWNPLFDDALTLWRHNSACAPELPFPHYQVAYFLHERGIYEPRDVEVHGAIEEYQTALAKNDAITARGYKGMPPDQLARAWLSLGSIFLEKLPEERRDRPRARDALEHAIDVGRKSPELDPEYGSALWLKAQLRHCNVGVTDEQAREALMTAATLRLSPELLQAVHDDLARLNGASPPAPQSH